MEEMTSNILVRVTATQKNEIIDNATAANMTVSEYIRVHTIARPMNIYGVIYRSSDGTIQNITFRATDEQDVYRCFDGINVVSVTYIAKAPFTPASTGDQAWRDEINAQSEAEADATIRDARPY